MQYSEIEAFLKEFNMLKESYKNLYLHVRNSNDIENQVEELSIVEDALILEILSAWEKEEGYSFGAGQKGEFEMASKKVFLDWQKELEYEKSNN